MGILSWTRDGEMVALGWTLLHFCWQGALIAVLYAVLDRMTMRAGTKVRYGVALLALSLMPLAALATFVEQAQLVVRVPSGGSEVVASQLGAIHTTLVKQFPVAAPLVTSSELWIAGNTGHLLPWIDSVWLTGVLLLALRAMGGWWWLQRLRRAARVAVPASVEASFLHVSRQLGMGRRVALRISDEVISPLAMGVWHATVILPVSAILQLAPAQLEAVLAHELAHIRRWDFLCNLLQTSIECLLFFHPAVWWISRRSRDLREICCDEVAACSVKDPLIYAEALLRLEERRSENLHLAMALKGRNGSLLIRVRQILGEGMTMESTTTSGLRMAILGAVVLGLLVGSRAADGLKLVHFKVPAHALEHTAVTPDIEPNPSLAVEAIAHPLPHPSRAIAAVADPEPAPVAEPTQVKSARTDDSEVKGSGTDYLQQMRDAGYPLDLEKDLDLIVSLRSLGVTTAYAKSMAQTGMGTPTLHQLVSLKSLGVTPEYVTGQRSSGIAPSNFQEVLSEKGVGVTPDYAKSIALLGMGTPTLHELISLKAQGVTPEYVAAMKASGIPPKNLHELASLRALNVTPEYAKAMAAAGFPGVNTENLISLRAQGVTPEYARWLKQTFADADLHRLGEASTFHIDADFIARAKSHGFTDTSLDKLVKLKMTGLLD
jgi:beta-lactamase regulating signal transducer with metallopeptidase domain